MHSATNALRSRPGSRYDNSLIMLTDTGMGAGSDGLKSLMVTLAADRIDDLMRIPNFVFKRITVY